MREHTFGDLISSFKDIVDKIYETPVDEVPDAIEELHKVTRVEVIDGTGRAYVMYWCKDVKVSYQDWGRTLKVFLSSDK